MSWRTEEWRHNDNHDPTLDKPFKRESLNRRRQFRREARNAGESLVASWAVPSLGIVDDRGQLHLTVKAI